MPNVEQNGYLEVSINEFVDKARRQFQALPLGSEVKLASRVGEFPEGTVVFRDMAPGGAGIIDLEDGKIKLLDLDAIAAAGFVVIT